MIAESAGDAFGIAPAFAIFTAGLFAADCRLRRIIVFASLLGHGEIQISRDRRSHPAGADNGLQQLDDAPLIRLLQLAGVLELPGAGRRLGALVRRIEQ